MGTHWICTIISFNHKLFKVNDDFVDDNYAKNVAEAYIKFLKKKLPVIIAVRSFLLYNKEPSDMGHFIVITKYEKGNFYYNDPKDGKQHKINEEDLMFAWFNNVLDSSAYLLVLQPKR